MYNFAVGKSDINGEDWGDIFAKAIDGDHLNRPVGLADVVLDNMAWSMKSVKNNQPLTCSKIRVISGRCSPDYSYDIANPHDDIEQTGRAVLNIWNERINIALDHFNPLRSSILIRNPIFTWQPHGSQFTIIYDVSQSATLFKIKRPPVFDFSETLSQIGFGDDWVTFIDKVELSI